MIRTSKCNYLFIDPRIKAYNKELFTSRTSGIDHHLSLPKKNTHTREIRFSNKFISIPHKKLDYKINKIL